MSARKIDYIIAGQGIAGTALAFRMLKAGLKFRVFDPDPPCGSSLVAAGIVNPITGRKLVKSWMIDEILPEVRDMYFGFEELLGRQFLYGMPIYKLLHNAGEQNDWLARRSDAEYLPYMADVRPCLLHGVKAPFGLGAILNGYWLDIEALIISFRKCLMDENMLIREAVDHRRVELLREGGVRYMDVHASGLVFCDGMRGMENPFFKGLPLSFAKGEIMTIRCPELGQLDGILNRNGFIIPLGGDRFKVGATFRWNDISPGPSESGRSDLKKRLEGLVSFDYEILDVCAGFRPTIPDRRPVLGCSHLHPSIYIFNGLGTKGVSLSAYFSRHLLNHLEAGFDLLSEVNVHRFAMPRG